MIEFDPELSSVPVEALDVMVKIENNVAVQIRAALGEKFGLQMYSNEQGVIAESGSIVIVQERERAIEALKGLNDNDLDSVIDFIKDRRYNTPE